MTQPTQSSMKDDLKRQIEKGMAEIWLKHEQGTCDGGCVSHTITVALSVLDQAKAQTWSKALRVVSETCDCSDEVCSCPCRLALLKARDEEKKV